MTDTSSLHSGMSLESCSVLLLWMMRGGGGLQSPRLKLPLRLPPLPSVSLLDPGV